MVIFCNDALNPNRPDSDYANEADAAEEANLNFALVDYEKLTR